MFLYVFVEGNFVPGFGKGDSLGDSLLLTLLKSLLGW